MKHKHSKWFYIVSAVVFLLAMGMFAYMNFWVNKRPRLDTEFGITYSWLYAQQLGLDPVETYKYLIEELDIDYVRLPLYWSEIEHDPGEYQWEIPDALLALSEKNNVNLTVVVGVKVPRWPECFIPDWAEKLNSTYQHHSVLTYIEDAVNRYKDSPSVIRWQVENEPFFPFGECPDPDAGQLKERIDLVRSLADQPIQVTASGEISPWLSSAESADILGISMYRQTWNDLFGYFVYPLSPEYYFLRARLVEDSVQKILISELQAEPWFFESIDSRPITDWYEVFTKENFQDNVQFARDAGLSEVYLWGAEWWYAMKEAGDNRLWEVAEDVFNKID
jgi:hypothetical protein